MKQASLIVLSTSALLFACSSTEDGGVHLGDGASSQTVNRALVAPGAPQLYAGYGGYQRAASGASEEAQVWIDQGWLLVYGFNHDEAIRSFREAARISPGCAMAWWGIAYANGVDVNDPEMGAAANAEAWSASREALRLSITAEPEERALIEALAERYAEEAPEDRGALDEAYAAAMERAYIGFPDDVDIAALYAESLMLLQPWDYWTPEGEPRERAGEIVSVLRSALDLSSKHPGANHFYIHAVEASPHPGRAEEAADRLQDLVPGSGHLVHMPSHIYVNVGRWEDAAAANERAIAVDEAYFEIAPEPSIYRLYYLHNVHFLAFATMMQGRSADAMSAAQRVVTGIPPEALDEMLKLADGMMPIDLHVMIRFGRWEDVLEVPEYPEQRKASRAMWHYARTVALANLGRASDARAELAALEAASVEVPEDWMIGVNPAAAVLAVAHGMAEGEVLWREGQADAAYEVLRKAVELEDALAYDEPPGWMQPVRHALGALLLAGDRAPEAEEVYRADLKDSPLNAWSLLGLDQALRAQDRVEEADKLAKTLNQAWSRADVEPPASCYCGVRPSDG